MGSNNIVNFPKSYNGPQDQEQFLKEIASNLETMKLYHIQEALSNIIPMIFTQLEVAGFNTDEEVVDIKDGALLIEALRSIMCRHYGMHHPFQNLSKEVFFPDQEEIGALRIADSLNIQLKKSSETN